MNLKENSYKLDCICDAIRRAYKQRLNFYAYRHPSDNNIFFGASTRVTEDKSCKGFIVAPFAPNQTSRCFIIPEEYTTDFPCDITSENPDIQLPHQPSTSYNQYIGQANTIIEHLKKNGGKIVLSRIISQKQEIDIPILFKILLETYPNAFVFCFFSKESGLWIGASPELLAKTSNGLFETMSLAGTRTTDSNNEWDNKCIEEQQIVTEYISNTLKSEGLQTVVSEVYCRKAGPVEHICNDISATLLSTEKVWQLIDKLSPTPALAGYPKEDAISLINNTEIHDRKYYGGYIGPISSSSISLYVNLRSMTYKASTCELYVGGGLTSKSIAEEEWLETENKSKTLLNAIENSHL